MRSQYNYAAWQRDKLEQGFPLGEVNNEPSLTVPDMTMSLREIFQRFASGQPLNVQSNLVYTGDDYYPDVREMDLVEREEALQATKEAIKGMEDAAQQRAKTHKDEAKKKQQAAKERDAKLDDTIEVVSTWDGKQTNRRESKTEAEK